MAGLLKAGRPGRADDATAWDLAHDGAGVEVGGDAVGMRGRRGLHLTISCGGWLSRRLAEQYARTEVMSRNCYAHRHESRAADRLGAARRAPRRPASGAGARRGPARGPRGMALPLRPAPDALAG